MELGGIEYLQADSNGGDEADVQYKTDVTNRRIECI